MSEAQGGTKITRVSRMGHIEWEDPELNGAEWINGSHQVEVEGTGQRKEHHDKTPPFGAPNAQLFVPKHHFSQLFVAESMEYGWTPKRGLFVDASCQFMYQFGY